MISYTCVYWIFCYTINNFNEKPNSAKTGSDVNKTLATTVLYNEQKQPLLKRLLTRIKRADPAREREGPSNVPDAVEVEYLSSSSWSRWTLSSGSVWVEFTRSLVMTLLCWCQAMPRWRSLLFSIFKRCSNFCFWIFSRTKRSSSCSSSFSFLFKAWRKF